MRVPRTFDWREAVPRTSIGEEHRLAIAAAAGDQRARGRLIEANLGLVRALARQYVGHGVGYEDLVQEGAAGLTQAVDRFDPTNGARLGTYASYWIKQAMMRALTEQSRPIRLPGYVVARDLHVRRAEREFEAVHGRVPTRSELSVEADIPVEELDLAVEPPRVAASLNALVADAAGAAELGELVADPASPDPELTAEEHERADAVHEAIDALPPRERTVVERHFGIEGQAETLEEIAADLHVARERVRQVEQHALAMLATRLPRPF
jgi:RNA polymerase primary sigma factor